MPRSTRIGFIFIGGGNRVQGLAGRLIAAGWPAESLAIADPDPAPRERVTSPGGTTAAALAKLARGDLTGLVERAVASATRRARELGGG